MSQQPTSSLRNFTPVYALIAVIGILYLLTLPVIFSQGEDGLNYVWQVSNGSLAYQFHGNHLLFNAFNFLVVHGLHAIGFTFPPLIIMQVTTVIAAVVVLLIVSALCRFLQLSTAVTAIVVASIGFSFAYWSYAAQPETYHIPLIFLLFTLLSVTRWSENPTQFRTVVAAAIGAIFTTLFHQQHILLIPAIAIAFLAMPTKEPIGWRTRAKAIIGFGCLTGLSIGAVYGLLAVTLGEAGTVGEVIAWSRGPHGGHTPAGFSFASVAQTFMGITKSIWGGIYLFHFSFVQDLANLLFPNKLTIEETFIGNNLSTTTAVILFALSITSIVSLLGIFFRFGRSSVVPHDNATNDPTITRSAYLRCWGAVCLVYITFNLWWEPINIEFWISLIPSSALAFGIFLERRWDPSASKVAFATCLIPLFLSNLLGSAIPMTNQQNDFWYQTNRYAIESLTEEDTLVTSKTFLNQLYLRHYSKARIVTPDQLNEIINSQNFRNSSGAVYISSFILSPRKTPETPPTALGSDKVLTPEAAAHHTLVEVNRNNFQAIWRITPRQQYLQGTKQ